VYELSETPEFRKQFAKLEREIRRRFQKQLRKVIQVPFSMGRPLGSPNFRELRQGVFRLYYQTKVIILILNVSDKDTQQEVIDLIRRKYFH